MKIIRSEYNEELATHISKNNLYDPNDPESYLNLIPQKILTGVRGEDYRCAYTMIEDGKPIGVICCEVRTKEAYAGFLIAPNVHIFVSPEHRNKGVGGKLTEALYSGLKKERDKNIIFVVAPRAEKLISEYMPDFKSITDEEYMTDRFSIFAINILYVISKKFNIQISKEEREEKTREFFERVKKRKTIKAAERAAK